MDIKNIVSFCKWLQEQINSLNDRLWNISMFNFRRKLPNHLCECTLLRKRKEVGVVGGGLEGGWWKSTIDGKTQLMFIFNLIIGDSPPRYRQRTKYEQNCQTIIFQHYSAMTGVTQTRIIYFAVYWLYFIRPRSQAGRIAGENCECFICEIRGRSAMEWTAVHVLLKRV